MKANDLVLRVVNEVEEGKFEIKEFKPYMSYESFIGCILADTEILRPTGLKDRNGKEIYEGDIIETDEYWIDNRYFLKKEIQVIYDIRKCNKLRPCIIIGNIYENPDLVQQVKDKIQLL